MENIIKIQLPKPHANQQMVLDSKSRFKTLMCGRRWGKTLIATIICIQKMLAGEKVAYVTPEYGLSKTFFNEILKYIPKELLKNDNKSELFIELITGGSLMFYSGEALYKFRGRPYHYIIVDECAFISNFKDEWFTSIRPTLSDYKGGALFISTPNGKEYFYSLYMKGINNETDYESFHFSSDTNPYFPKDEWESIKQSIPEFQFKQEYLAIAGESTSTAIQTRYIQANTILTLSTKPTIVFGIDLAKYQDYTSITGLDEDGVMSYHDWFQLPWHLTQNKIESLPADVLKAVDSTGVGDVVFENLEMTCSNIIGHKFTTESKPKVIYELIKDVENGKLKFNEKTANEMYVFEYSYSSTGHIKFGNKAGYHDDTIISLALANHYKQQAKASQTWGLYYA